MSALPRFFPALLAFVVGAFVFNPTLRAETEASVSGTVRDRVAGLVLSNARVTVIGSTREAFTDEFGIYRLTGLPTGEVRIQVAYTGMSPEVVTLTLTRGEAAQRDVALLATNTTVNSTDEATLQFDPFVVAAAKETNAAAIALNEQRYSPNIKTVVSTDALGDVAGNNIGDFLKYLPGVEVPLDDSGGEASAITVRGMPGYTTPMMIDGEAVTTTATTLTRGTPLQTMSLANTARMEITKVPTPDISATSLGGAVNLISRTAFEASKPQLRVKTSINMNTNNFTFKRQPGTKDGNDQSKVYNYEPDFEVTYTMPVSKDFGFSVNAVKHTQFRVNEIVNRSFNTTVLASNPLKSTSENPYLQQLVYTKFPIAQKRYTFGSRLDWRITPADVFTFSYSGNWFEQDNEQHQFVIATGTNPVAWGPDSTQGRARSGSVNVRNTTRYTRIRNNIFRLNYRHTGVDWDITAGAGYNFSVQSVRAASYGQLETTAGRITNATVSFNGFSEYLPGTITVLNSDNQVVDPFLLSSYSFFLNGAAQTRDIESDSKSGRVDFKRKFSTDKLNASVKFGLHTTEDFRSSRLDSFNPTFVGADGVAATNDERFSVLPVDLLNYSRQAYDMPRGLAQVQFPSSTRAMDLYKAYPQYFTYTTAAQRNDLRVFYNNYMQITERIDSAYLMSDVSFMNNRLRAVGGVRYERTTDDGRSVLVDENAKYQRDPVTGNLILTASRQPILITSDVLAQDALVYQPLANRTHQQYDDYYPSLSLSYNLTENLVARAGAARTLGRPNFANIIGPTTVTQVDFDPNSSASGAALGVISARNPALKPWTGKNYDVRLEYYPEKGGEISVGYYHKELKNFFVNRTFVATEEFLESVGLAPEYVGYQVTLPYNLSDVAFVKGWEFNVVQPLSAFTALPVLRGTRVFASATFSRTSGAGGVNLPSFAPEIVNGGFQVSYRRLTFYGKATYVGRKLVEEVESRLGDLAYTYLAPQFRTDISVDYRINKNFSAFFAGTNIFNTRSRHETYNDKTPAYARFEVEREYGGSLQFGVKAQF